MITRIELQNFRTFELAAFDLTEARTLILGENGTGKSTIVDAIAWALTGRCRGVDGKGQGQKDLIRVGAESMTVELQTTRLGTITRTLDRANGSSVNLKTDAILARLGVSEATLLATIYGASFFGLHHADAKALLMALLDVRIPPDQLPGLHLTAPAALDDLEQLYQAAFAARAAAKKAVAAVHVPDAVVNVDLVDVDLATLRKDLHDATGEFQALARTQATHAAKAQTLRTQLAELDQAVAGRAQLEGQVTAHQTMVAEAQGKLALAQQQLDAVNDGAAAESIDTLDAQSRELTLLVEKVQRHDPNRGCVLSAGIPCLTKAGDFAGHITKLKADVKALDKRVKAERKRQTTLAAQQQLVGDQTRAIEYSNGQLSKLREQLQALDVTANGRPSLVSLIADVDQLRAAADSDVLAATQRMTDLQQLADRVSEYERAVAARTEAVKLRDKLKADLKTQEDLVELLGPKGVRATALQAALGDFEAMVNAALKPYGFTFAITVDPWQVRVTTPAGAVPFTLLSAGEQLWTGLAFQLALAAASGLDFAVLDAAEAVVGKNRQVLTQLVMQAPVGQVVVAMARGAEDASPELDGLQVLRLDQVDRLLPA